MDRMTNYLLCLIVGIGFIFGCDGDDDTTVEQDQDNVIDSEGDDPVDGQADAGQGDHPGNREKNCGFSPDWEMHVIGDLVRAMYFYTVDLDGDGDLDVVAAGWAHDDSIDSEVAWFQNNGANENWDKIIISSDTLDPIKSIAGVVAADIDGDGHIDVAAATGRTNPAQVYWFKAPSQPTQADWERHLVYEESGEMYYKIYAWDANGDNATDLVAGGKRAILLENPLNPEAEGATWGVHPLPEKTGSFIFLDDLNEDGKADLLSSSFNTGTVSWTEIDFSNSEFTFDMHLIKENLAGTFDLFPVDINEDGLKDVLVSRIMNTGIKWYASPAQPTGIWTEHTVSKTYSGADMYAGDINQDGITDFVVAGVAMGSGTPDPSNVTWFETKDKGATWNSHLVWCFDGDGPGDISLNDIDDDGDLDIVTTGNERGRVIWYENKLPR